MTLDWSNPEHVAVVLVIFGGIPALLVIHLRQVLARGCQQQDKPTTEPRPKRRRSKS